MQQLHYTRRAKARWRASPRSTVVRRSARRLAIPNRGCAVAGAAAMDDGELRGGLRTRAQRRRGQPVALQETAKIAQLDTGLTRGLGHVAAALAQRLGQGRALEVGA